MPEFLELRVAVTALEGRVDRMDAVATERQEKARDALNLAREIQDTKLAAFNERLQTIERLQAAQSMKFALWAGVGSAIAFFVGKLVGKE